MTICAPQRLHETAEDQARTDSQGICGRLAAYAPPLFLVGLPSVENCAVVGLQFIEGRPDIPGCGRLRMGCSIFAHTSSTRGAICVLSSGESYRLFRFGLVDALCSK